MGPNIPLQIAMWQEPPFHSRSQMRSVNVSLLGLIIGKVGSLMRTRAKGPHGRSLFPVSLAWSMPRSIAPPSGRDASPSQGYPPGSMSPVPIYAPGWRDSEAKWSKVPCLRKQRDGRGLNPGFPDPEFEVFTAQPHTPPLIRVDNTVGLIIPSPNRKRKALPQIPVLRLQTKRTIPKIHEPGPPPKPVKTLLPWGQ